MFGAPARRSWPRRTWPLRLSATSSTSQCGDRARDSARCASTTLARTMIAQLPGSLLRRSACRASKRAHEVSPPMARLAGISAWPTRSSPSFAPAAGRASAERLLDETRRPTTSSSDRGDAQPLPGRGPRAAFAPSPTRTAPCTASSNTGDLSTQTSLGGWPAMPPWWWRSTTTSDTPCTRGGPDEIRPPPSAESSGATTVTVASPVVANAIFVNPHHIKWWKRDRGRTDLDNLALLCEHHHHLVHSRSWRMSGDGNGELSFVGPSGRTMTSRPSPLWVRVTAPKKKV